MLRQTTDLPRDPGHDVTWITDDHDDSIRAVLDQFRDEILEDVDVPLHQVKTRLSFLLAHSCRDDNHSRILQPQSYTKTN